MSDANQDTGTAQESASPSRFVVPLVILVVMAGLGFWVYKSLGSSKSSGKHQTVKIAVLPDTPPPPPPPPPPDKKIEPEVKDLKPQPQQEDQPKPLDKAPEPEQIKMEGAAGDGPSAFGSGSVSKDYQAGDPNTGMGSGGVNKMQFALFTSRLTRHIQSELARNKDLKVRDYRVNVRVWLGQDGALQRIELASSTGDESQDAQLRQALAKIPPLDAIPGNLPQPLTMRITNRVTG